MDSVGSPVACSLLDSELQGRRRDVLQKVRREVSAVKELENGFTYCFPLDGTDGTRIRELAEMVELERHCCPFLKFSITVEPGNGLVWLEMDNRATRHKRVSRRGL